MSHTKGPWKAETPKTMFTSVTWIHSGNNIMNPIFGVTGKNFKANAERIVACVNACEGASNETLESMYITGSNPMDRIKALKAECDLAYTVEQALLDAIKPFAALLHPHHGKQNDSNAIFAVNDAKITFGDLRKAVAAINLAEGNKS